MIFKTHLLTSCQELHIREATVCGLQGSGKTIRAKTNTRRFGQNLLTLYGLYVNKFT